MRTHLLLFTILIIQARSEDIISETDYISCMQSFKSYPKYNNQKTIILENVSLKTNSVTICEMVSKVNLQGQGIKEVQFRIVNETNTSFYVEEINLSNNKLKQIDIGNAPFLRKIDLSSNELSFIYPLTNNKELETLDLSNNEQLSFDLFSILPKSCHIDVSNTLIYRNKIEENNDIIHSNSCIYGSQPVNPNCPCDTLFTSCPEPRCKGSENKCQSSCTDIIDFEKDLYIDKDKSQYCQNMGNDFSEAWLCSVFKTKEDCELRKTIFPTDTFSNSAAINLKRDTNLDKSSYYLHVCEWFPDEEHPKEGYCGSIDCLEYDRTFYDRDVMYENGNCLTNKDKRKVLARKCINARNDLRNLAKEIQAVDKSFTVDIGSIDYDNTVLNGVSVNRCMVSINNNFNYNIDSFTIRSSFESVDLSKVKSISELRFDDLSDNYALSNLNVANNKLTTLPKNFFRRLTELTTIDLSNNYLLKTVITKEGISITADNTLVSGTSKDLNRQENNCVGILQDKTKCCYGKEQNACDESGNCNWNINSNICDKVDEANVVCNYSGNKTACEKLSFDNDRLCAWDDINDICVNPYDDQPACADYTNESACKRNNKCFWCLNSCHSIGSDIEAIDNNGICGCSNIKTGITCQELDGCQISTTKDAAWRLGEWYCEPSEKDESNDRRWRNKETRGESSGMIMVTLRDSDYNKVSCESREGYVWCDSQNSCISSESYNESCDCNTYNTIDECLSLPGCKLCHSTLKCMSKSNSDDCVSCSTFSIEPEKCVSFPNCRFCSGECKTKQAPCETCTINDKNGCAAQKKCSYCESTTRCNSLRSESVELCNSCSGLEINKCAYYHNGCEMCGSKCTAKGMCEAKTSHKVLLIVGIVVGAAAVVFISCIFVTIIIRKQKNELQSSYIRETSLIPLSDFTSRRLSETKDFASPTASGGLAFVPSEKVSNPSELGIQLDVAEVAFSDETNSGLLTVNKEYQAVFHISCTSGSKSSVPFALQISCTDRHKITVIPQEVKVSHNPTEITCTLSMKGSGKLQAVLNIGNVKTGKYFVVPIIAEAMASCFLSLSEVKIGKQLGAGAYGKVYIGEYRSTPVAIKEIGIGEVGLGETDGFTEIDKEVLMMSKLKSPYIVELYGVVYTEKSVYTVMELCKLGTVTSYLKKQKGKTPRALRLAFCLDAARGVLYLHQNKIIHRDLKPDNLLLVSDSADAPVRAKVSDFGTSRFVANENEQALTRATGTPAFMAPEVLEGKPYSLPADIYSLGMTFWSIFMERIPFDDAKNSYEMYQRVERGEMPEMPKDQEVAELIRKCCCVELEKRLKGKKVVSLVAELIENEISGDNE